jgi:hypothetical protein
MPTTVQEKVPTSTVPAEWPHGEPESVRRAADAKQATR